jgi:hypothetical protein
VMIWDLGSMNLIDEDQGGGCWGVMGAMGWVAES